jgi:carboxymethylenebutenolidase
MGGTVTFLAAARHPLGAAVSFYGGGVAEGRFGMPPLIELAPELETPWLGLFRDLDQGIDVEGVERLREAVRRAPVPAEVTSRVPPAEPTRQRDSRAPLGSGSFLHRRQELDGH